MAEATPTTSDPCKWRRMTLLHFSTNKVNQASGWIAKKNAQNGGMANETIWFQDHLNSQASVRTKTRIMGFQILKHVHGTCNNLSCDPFAQNRCAIRTSMLIELMKKLEVSDFTSSAKKVEGETKPTVTLLATWKDWCVIILSLPKSINLCRNLFPICGGCPNHPTARSPDCCETCPWTANFSQCARLSGDTLTRCPRDFRRCGCTLHSDSRNLRIKGPGKLLAVSSVKSWTCRRTCTSLWPLKNRCPVADSIIHIPAAQESECGPSEIVRSFCRKSSGGR